MFSVQQVVRLPLQVLCCCWSSVWAISPQSRDTPDAVSAYEVQVVLLKRAFPVHLWGCHCCHGSMKPQLLKSQLPRRHPWLVQEVDNEQSLFGQLQERKPVGFSACLYLG